MTHSDIEDAMAYRAAYIDDSDTGGLAYCFTSPEDAALSEDVLRAKVREAIIRGAYYDKVEDGKDALGRPRYRDVTIDEMMKKVVIGDFHP